MLWESLPADYRKRGIFYTNSLSLLQKPQRPQRIAKVPDQAPQCKVLRLDVLLACLASFAVQNPNRYYTDEYCIYRQVLPASRHRPRPKGHGATSQVDRAHTTFRQWCANLVRKTLSFSRDVHLHAVRLRLVVDAYNAERAGIW